MKATLNLKREQLNSFRVEKYTSLSGGMHFHAPIEVLWVKEGLVDLWTDRNKIRVNKG